MEIKINSKIKYVFAIISFLTLSSCKNILVERNDWILVTDSTQFITDLDMSVSFNIRSSFHSEKINNVSKDIWGSPYIISMALRTEENFDSVLISNIVIMTSKEKIDLLDSGIRQKFEVDDELYVALNNDLVRLILDVEGVDEITMMIEFDLEKSGGNQTLTYSKRYWKKTSRKKMRAFSQWLQMF